MQRYDIIRHLIEKRGYKSYLEIGVLGNETYNALPSLDVKHSVDPNGQAVFNMTSDEFFSSYCSQTYDIIFIDGLHLAEQVQRDIENSLTHLNEDGIIVCHDMLPTEEWHQFREGVDGKPWTGDCWRAFVNLKSTRLDLKMCVVDTDWGCGLIEKLVPGSWQTCLLAPYPEPTWGQFLAHRDIMMNVITVEEFLGRT